MIKSSVKFEEYCDGCRYLNPETSVERIYADNEIAEINITLTCRHRDICERLEKLFEV